MTGLGWLTAIIVGGIAGWIAEKIMKSDMGMIANIIIGIIGAVFFNWLLSFFGVIAAPTVLVQGLVGVIGACLLIALWRLIKGKKPVV